jgi:hypothetical protein
VSVMVLCYRQTVILRPTSKHCSANALMSCVDLGRSSLVTFCMTSSRAPTYFAWQTTRLSKDQVSSTRARMIGICMQHNMFLITMHDISSCCSAWCLSIVVPSRLRSYACSNLARRRDASCALRFWLLTHCFPCVNMGLSKCG